MHTIPQIDSIQRDPVMESYQNQGAITQNITISNKQDEKEQTKNNDESQEKDLDEIQIDDGEKEKSFDDSNDEVLPKYTDEQLEKVNLNDIHMKKTSVDEHLAKEKPNFNILDEYLKRVCFTYKNICLSIKILIFKIY